MIITKCPAWESSHLITKFDAEHLMAVPDRFVANWCTLYKCPCAEHLGCHVKELVTYCLDRDLPVYEFMGVDE